MSCLVLLSAGLDSTYNLYRALTADAEVTAMTVDYGQRAAKKEVECARRMCARMKVCHHVLELPWFRDFTQTSLVDRKFEVPTRNLDISDSAKSRDSAQKVWVPNRNGILCEIAAGYAEGWGLDHIIVGFNAEEAASFPDNSSDYLSSLNNSLKYSTSTGVKVQSYSLHMKKVDMIRDGLRLQMNFDEIWPCYLGGESWCGQCESCMRFIRAARMAGLNEIQNYT